MNPISLASGVMPDHGSLEMVAAAVAEGVDAVGPWVEPKEWTAAMTRDTRTALADLYPRCRRACH